MSVDERLDELARDLAAAAGVSLDEATRALRNALVGDVQPIRTIKRMPWYLRPRWIPVKWQQRWLFRYWMLAKDHTG